MLKLRIVGMLVVLMIISHIVLAQNNNPIFCTKGVSEYFRIVDILKQDKFPTEDDWKQFLSSPGYNVLCELEFGNTYLRDLITIAFKPSEQSNQKEVLAKYKKRGRYFEIFAENTFKGFKEAEQYRSEIQEYIKFISTPVFIREIEKYVNEFIDDAKIDSTFKVNFIVFDDSRGYDPIIVGITNPGIYSAEQTTCLKEKWGNTYIPTVLLMAHEAFHNIKNKRLHLEVSSSNDEDKTLLKLLNDIHNEGIADQINVPLLYEKDGCLSKSERAISINQEQKYQYAIIHSLDYFLTQIAQDESLKVDLSRAMNSLIARSGHPTGYYMARVIATQLGNNELKCVALNPFQFIISYNNAAKSKTGLPVFSGKAIDYIIKLEGKYIKTN